MKSKACLLFLALFIIVAVLYIIPFNVNNGFSYWFDLVKVIGERDVPTLHEFLQPSSPDDGFFDKIANVFQNAWGLGKFMIEWVRYWAYVLSTMFVWVTGGVRPV